MSTPFESPTRDRANRPAGARPDDQPVDLDSLMAAGAGEYEDEPTRRSVIRFAVIVGVGILLFVLLVHTGAQWVAGLDFSFGPCEQPDIFSCPTGIN